MIVELLYTLAKSHKDINAFIYNRINTLGNGYENYPLFWLEDPVRTTAKTNNILSVDINFSVTEIPADDSEIPAIQHRCFLIGLSFIEKLKRMKQEGIMSVSSFNAITLRNYYDNDASGYRFSVSLEILNPQNLCELDDMFDEEKEFAENDLLPSFDTSNKDGCAIFSDECQLPNFSLK